VCWCALLVLCAVFCAECLMCCVCRVCWCAMLVLCSVLCNTHVLLCVACAFRVGYVCICCALWVRYACIACVCECEWVTNSCTANSILKQVGSCITYFSMNWLGVYPETVAVSLWGLDAIKIKGESVGIVLHTGCLHRIITTLSSFLSYTRHHHLVITACLHLPFYVFFLTHLSVECLHLIYTFMVHVWDFPVTFFSRMPSPHIHIHGAHLRFSCHILQ
jgi:hypothetical protein